MKKLFILTVSSKKYRVENLWYLYAADHFDFAKQVIQDPGHYKEILTSLGGRAWDCDYKWFEQPSPKSILSAIERSFGEEYWFQLFEAPLNIVGRFEASEIRKDELIDAKASKIQAYHE